jgi:hypothetical protein
MKKHPLTATGLRIILSISLFLIAAIGATLFSVANKTLKGVAIDTSHTVADASAGQANLQNLQKLEENLKTKQAIVDRAANIVAESRSYEYQNQIINDLNDYAKRAGVSILTIDFSGGNPTGAPTTPTTPAPVPSTTVNGVKSTSVAITLKNPVDYYAVLRFVKSIEQNLTKMQISNIGLSKNTDGNGVSTDALNIEVYIK